MLDFTHLPSCHLKWTSVACVSCKLVVTPRGLISFRRDYFWQDFIDEVCFSIRRHPAVCACSCTRVVCAHTCVAYVHVVCAHIVCVVCVHACGVHACGVCAHVCVPVCGVFVCCVCTYCVRAHVWCVCPCVCVVYARVWCVWVWLAATVLSPPYHSL